MLLIVLFCSFLSAFEHYTLDNGLELFVIENHTTPLMHFNVTFKTGSINETEKTNGLSHLFEHMLFKGNDLYKNQNAFMAALQSMGASNWNGHTGEEHVSYYFTIPSSKTEKAIEFWAHAIINPSLSEQELSKERVVVHNEVAGQFASPGYQFHQKVLKAMYYKYPFRRNPGGDLSIIDNATVEQLNYIKENFYIPNNTAIFIAGDVNPINVLNLIKKYFSSWKKGPAIAKLKPHPSLSKDTWVVLDNNPSKGQIEIHLSYMGPNADTETKYTYSADIFTTMLNEPDGKFKNNIYKNVPELFGETRNIGTGYYTQREGETYLRFLVKVDEKKDMFEVINRLIKNVDIEINKMLENNYFSGNAFETSINELHNHHLLAKETIESYSGEISFWWAVASTDYYFNYFENLKKISLKDIQQFIKIFLKKPRLISVWVNKDDNQSIKLTERIK